MDQRLREYAARWRDAEPPSPAPDAAGLGPGRRGARTWWLAAATAAAVAAVILGGTRIVGDEGSRKPSEPAGAARPTGTAAPGTDELTASGSPTEGSQDSTGKADPRAVRWAVNQIQTFLDVWRREGMLVAARRYFDAASQPRSAAGLQRLSYGKVLSAHVSSWESSEHFTLEVSLDLHFVGGPMAWNDGKNDRFITVTRHGSSVQLDLATSP
jgi:hypothetical protein